MRERLKKKRTSTVVQLVERFMYLRCGFAILRKSIRKAQELQFKYWWSLMFAFLLLPFSLSGELQLSCQEATTPKSTVVTMSSAVLSHGLWHHIYLTLCSVHDRVPQYKVMQGVFIIEHYFNFCDWIIRVILKCYN